MNLERYKTNVGYAQLDAVIEELSPLADPQDPAGLLDTKVGESHLMSMIVMKLSDGINPAQIAEDLQVPFMVLWEWLKADTKRMELYDEAHAMWANKLHAEVIGIADSASIEDVQVAKLRIETRFKAASNYDKKRFGNSMKVDINQTHTVNINQLLNDRLNRIGNIVDVKQIAENVTEV